MAHNYYSEIFLHITWHTKDDARLLIADVEDRAHRYIAHRIAETPGVFMHEIGGIEDHVHVVLNTPPTLLVSDWIGQLKGASTHHLNQNVMERPTFAWQVGYGVVSFGKKDLEFVCEYVKNQKVRHAEGRIHERLERVDSLERAKAVAREAR